MAKTAASAIPPRRSRPRAAVKHRGRGADAPPLCAARAPAGRAGRLPPRQAPWPRTGRGRRGCPRLHNRVSSPRPFVPPRAARHNRPAAASAGSPLPRRERVSSRCIEPRASKRVPSNPSHALRRAQRCAACEDLRAASHQITRAPCPLASALPTQTPGCRQTAGGTHHEEGRRPGLDGGPARVRRRRSARPGAENTAGCESLTREAEPMLALRAV